MHRKTLWTGLVLLTVIAAAIPFITRLLPPEKLQIGYSGCLSGRSSEIGREGLRGVQLAIDAYQASSDDGAVQIELHVADNRCQPQTSRQAVEQLLNKDVDVIIGHMLSEMSLATLESLNSSGVVMISPTSATRKLSGKDDNFLRVYPDIDIVGRKMADYASNYLGIKRLAVIYDRSNNAFTRDLANAVSEHLAPHGGQVVTATPFNGLAPDMSYAAMVEQLQRSHAEGLLILANPSDTAMLCQQVVKQRLEMPLLAAEWSYSPLLQRMAGDSIKQLAVFKTVTDQDATPRYRDFAIDYQQRYDSEPWFASVHSYDATSMALEALIQNPDAQQLKQNLLNFGTYTGLQSQIILDENGDAERVHYVEQLTVHGHKLLAML